MGSLEAPRGHSREGPFRGRAPQSPLGTHFLRSHPLVGPQQRPAAHSPMAQAAASTSPTCSCTAQRPEEQMGLPRLRSLADLLSVCYSIAWLAYI